MESYFFFFLFFFPSLSLLAWVQSLEEPTLFLSLFSSFFPSFTLLFSPPFFILFCPPLMSSSHFPLPSFLPFFFLLLFSHSFSPSSNFFFLYFFFFCFLFPLSFFFPFLLLFFSLSSIYYYPGPPFPLLSLSHVYVCFPSSPSIMFSFLFISPLYQGGCYKTKENKG